MEVYRMGHHTVSYTYPHAYTAICKAPHKERNVLHIYHDISNVHIANRTPPDMDRNWYLKDGRIDDIDGNKWRSFCRSVVDMGCVIVQMQILSEL